MTARTNAKGHISPAAAPSPKNIAMTLFVDIKPESQVRDFKRFEGLALHLTTSIGRDLAGLLSVFAAFGGSIK
jgi:hypothetical protein